MDNTEGLKDTSVVHELNEINCNLLGLFVFTLGQEEGRIS